MTLGLLRTPRDGQNVRGGRSRPSRMTLATGEAQEGNLTGPAGA